eukprot:1176881-Prorocentrum_minimum.AAC.4
MSTQSEVRKKTFQKSFQTLSSLRSLRSCPLVCGRLSRASEASPQLYSAPSYSGPARCGAARAPAAVLRSRHPTRTRSCPPFHPPTSLSTSPDGFRKLVSLLLLTSPDGDGQGTNAVRVVGGTLPWFNEHDLRPSRFTTVLTQADWTPKGVNSA